MKRKPKIDHLLDQVFAFYIKCRDDWRCVFCGVHFSFTDTKNLHCSHYHLRQHQGTRYNEENCDAFCRRCHERLEKQTKKGQEYYNWKIMKLGGSKFGELLLLAQGITQLRGYDKITLTQHFIEKIDKLEYDTEVFKKKLLAYI